MLKWKHKTGLVPGACSACMVLFLLAGCLVSGTGARSTTALQPELDSAVRAAWRGIGASPSSCEEFDYFPGGGMRNFYCHAMYFMEYRRFAALVGLPVFISGPHTNELLVLDSRYSFGRYNPAFVSRLAGMLVPGAHDSAFRHLTQGVYDESIRPLARIFFITYLKLMDNPSYLVQESELYLKAIRARTLEPYYYEKYFSFLDCEYPLHGKNLSDFSGPDFSGTCDGNVVKTCVAFWIRRSIDGTDDEFFAALVKLLKVYDGKFYGRYQPFPGGIQ